MKKRVYVSEVRNAQAAKTRVQILKAAKALFLSEGFDAVTIDRLAQAAGVSTPTVYALFKSKRGILQSLIDESLPPEQLASLIEEAMTETSPQKSMRVAAKFARQRYDAERELIDILRGASVLSPELKELEQEREKWRYERQADFVGKLMQEKILNPKLTITKAREILWALTSRDLYRMLVIEKKWTSDAYEDWLTAILTQSLQ